MNTKRLQAKLNKARTGKGLTFRDVSKLSRGKLSHSFVYDTERGLVQEPSPSKLRVLSQILELDYMELLQLAGYITKSDLSGFILIHKGNV